MKKILIGLLLLNSLTMISCGKKDDPMVDEVVDRATKALNLSIERDKERAYDIVEELSEMEYTKKEIKEFFIEHRILYFEEAWMRYEINKK